MQKPRALKRGDRVAVLAPASPFDRTLFDGGVAELRALGFEPVIDEGVFERRGYVAGAASHRAAALRAVWRDPDVAAVIAVRGGYGSAQLLPLLDPAEAAAARKPLIGCSDLTAILIYLTTICQAVCFHGPMVVNLARRAEGYDRASLMGSVGSPEPLGELSPAGVEALRTGEARGPLLGGTLTQILASLGTPFAFQPPQGYVLLLDDIGERPYRIDRMLTQLRQTGLLARASAVVCAEFPDCREPEGGGATDPHLDARAVIAELLGDFGGPVLFGFPSGHTAGPTWTLPLGVEVTVSTTPRPRVVIEEAAVE